MITVVSKQSLLTKPFIKWAGGKGQLLNEISARYPLNLGKELCKYCEPFIGGGAVFFDIVSKHEFKEILINDINFELVNVYRQIKENVDVLIEKLESLQEEYLSASSEKRSEMFYERRNEFNSLKTKNPVGHDANKAALLIFLNKTCFNGLYRVNSKGEFNVPAGSYKNPMICDKKTLKEDSKALQNTEIRCGDYKECIEFIDSSTFVYIDPPYKPISKTASFNSYSHDPFGDTEQIALGEFVKIANKKGAKIMLSNSDPKNVDPDDNFFDEIYEELHIERIQATRMINSVAKNRGAISEILVTNYKIKSKIKNLNKF